MLGSVVGALAANMVLVQCNSDLPISLACSGSQCSSLEFGIIGTASQGGPRRPAVRQATVGGPASQATFGVGPSERKSVPSTHIRSWMTPVAHDSGTLRGKRAIAGGRLAQRPVMFQAALVAAHHNPNLRSFADRLRKADKPHKVIITAVARILITIANVLRKKRQKWVATDP